MKTRAALVLLLATLAGCTHYSLVADKQRAIGGVYTVDPQIAWSKHSEGNVELWTVDGPGLQAVRFFKGLRDGDQLIATSDKTNPATFKSGMKASDILELVVDSLTRSGAGEVDATALRPAAFGPFVGFRFDLVFLTSDGLRVRGLAAGAVIKEKLHLILYTGADTHYFGKYLDQVERLLASIEAA